MTQPEKSDRGLRSAAERATGTLAAVYAEALASLAATQGPVIRCKRCHRRHRRRAGCVVQRVKP